jgi:PAS domain S-box-containing protein
MVRGVVLVFRDVSERRRSERELQESEERFRLMANTAPVLIWMAGADKEYVFFNRPWLEFTGRTFEQERGTGWLAGVHSDDRDRRISTFAAAFDVRRSFQMEYRLRRADGEYRWLLDSGVPRQSYDGTFAGYIGSCIDVTDRKVLEQQLEERIRDLARDNLERRRAEQRNQFLADASASLAELVDHESTLKKICGLAVPTFADWCTVDILEADGALRRLAVNHADPAKASTIAELQQRFPPDPDSPYGVGRIVRTGEHELIPEITDSLLRERVHDERLLEVLRTLGLKSLIAVPFSVRGTIIGAITFVAAESGRRFDNYDLAIAEELAHRSAVAVDNARLYEALRESDRRKDEFLAMLAHELRNPLAPVRNSLQILKQPDTDPATAEQARSIAERQVDQLTRLVDDLLDVSRIMRGRIELRKERVELAAIVTRAFEAVQALIDVEGHRLSVTLPDGPVWVLADVVRLSQVIANLLNNAAKYTPPGGRIELIATLENADLVLIVRDNGIGIAPEALPRIFDMFMQAAPDVARSKGGLGIGLKLVKTLIELHGGTIEARSPGPDQGTEFVIRLPNTVDMSPARRQPFPATPPLAANSAEKRRILVVDDNEDAANSLGMLLRLLGHEVRVAHGGRAGLDAARAEPPEVMLLDIGMPDMDGYQVARQVRSLPSGADVVLVALTGWGHDHDRRRSREAGFDLHLTKPVEPRALHEILARPLRLRGGTGPVREQGLAASRENTNEPLGR